MRPQQIAYRDNQVASVVAERGEPFALSLAEDIHIFHFERDGAWQKGEVLLVNRNGHHFRLMRESNGKFGFYKFWNGLFATPSWQEKSPLQYADPLDCIKLCGSGPQGKDRNETLSFLPKEATSGKRRVVWRGSILPVRFIPNQGFRLQFDGQESSTFSGEAWTSTEAARWCLANVNSPVTPFIPANPATLCTEDTAALEELEANGIWGMF
jgi:hypothetical protein